MQSLLETEGLEDQCRVSQSPLGGIRKKGTSVRPTLTPRHSERALLSSDSTSSSERNSIGRLGGIVRWFRGTKKERCSIDLESGNIAPDLAASFIRHGSLKIQGRRAGEGIGRSLQRARRRVERRLGRMGIGKGKKKVTGTEEVSGSCKLVFGHNSLSIDFNYLFSKISVEEVRTITVKVQRSQKSLCSRSADWFLFNLSRKGCTDFHSFLKFAYLVRYQIHS